MTWILESDKPLWGEAGLTEYFNIGRARKEEMNTKNAGKKKADEMLVNSERLHMD